MHNTHKEQKKPNKAQEKQLMKKAISHKLAKRKASTDRMSPDKVRFNLVIRRDLLEQFREVAREKDISLSQLFLRLATAGLEESKQFETFFIDPAVRRLFADMASRPGALQALMKAAGATEPPQFVQDTIFSLLSGEPPKG